MTVYEKVMSMNKEEFIEFMEDFYYKSWKDGYSSVDDGPWIRQRMADAEEGELEVLFEDLW